MDKLRDAILIEKRRVTVIEIARNLLCAPVKEESRHVYDLVTSQWCSTLCYMVGCFHPVDLVDCPDDNVSCAAFYELDLASLTNVQIINAEITKFAALELPSETIAIPKGEYRVFRAVINGKTYTCPVSYIPPESKEVQYFHDEHRSDCVDFANTITGINKSMYLSYYMQKLLTVPILSERQRVVDAIRKNWEKLTVVKTERAFSGSYCGSGLTITNAVFCIAVVDPETKPFIIDPTFIPDGTYSIFRARFGDRIKI